MLPAIDLAKDAFKAGEIPVGAVIVKDGEIIARGRNRREEKKSALSHAEIEAINEACKITGDWRLDGCEMYVTLEPCPMCAGAIVNARIKTLVFGAYDLSGGCAESRLKLRDLSADCQTQVFGGICEDNCTSLLRRFFERVRNEV